MARDTRNLAKKLYNDSEVYMNGPNKKTDQNSELEKTQETQFEANHRQYLEELMAYKASNPEGFENLHTLDETSEDDFI